MTSVTDSSPGLCNRIEHMLQEGLVDVTIDVRSNMTGLMEMLYCNTEVYTIQ